jgi:hypothetical protein
MGSAAGGLQPLKAAERHELLSGVYLFEALETVARLQGQWDVEYTTQETKRVEAEFLSSGNGKACRQARLYIARNNDFLVSPRAAAQLMREIIEFASADESVPSIDLNTLVHMLLSITTEQNLNPEFAGDVPTDDEKAKLQREIGKVVLRKHTNTPSRSSLTKSRRHSSISH